MSSKYYILPAYINLHKLDIRTTYLQNPMHYFSLHPSQSLGLMLFFTIYIFNGQSDVLFSACCELAGEKDVSFKTYDWSKIRHATFSLVETDNLFTSNCNYAGSLLSFLLCFSVGATVDLKIGWSLI